MSRDARLLLGSGAAYSVAGASALTARIDAWIRDPESRRVAGMRAKQIVYEGLGADERSYAIVEKLLPGQPLSPNGDRDTDAQVG